jgi:hypothetical protein
VVLFSGGASLHEPPDDPVEPGSRPSRLGSSALGRELEGRVMRCMPGTFPGVGRGARLHTGGVLLNRLVTASATTTRSGRPTPGCGPDFAFSVDGHGLASAGRRQWTPLTGPLTLEKSR